MANFVDGTPDTYKGIIEEAAKKYGVATELLSALLKHESGFNPNAQSPAGAQGIAQFMPETAKGMEVDPFDVVSAINGAARYLKNSFDVFGSWELALAAYNAGGGAVGKYGGIPPYPETQNYVKNIMAEAGGLNPSLTAPTPTPEWISLADTPTPTPNEKQKWTKKMLEENKKPVWQRIMEGFNPFRASASEVPGMSRQSNMMTPTSSYSSQYYDRFNPTSVNKPANTGGGNSYTVKSGDTLWDIAQRTLGSGSRWQELGGYSGSPTQLPVGQKLTIPSQRPTFTPQMSRNLPMTPVSQNRPQYSTQPKMTYQTPARTVTPVPTPTYKAPKQSTQRQPIQSVQPKKTNLLDAIINIFRTR